MYRDLLRYFIENGFNENGNDPCGYIKSLLRDTYNEDLMGEIENHFNEEDMLRDLPTAVIKDMFLYYTKHKK